VCVNIHIVLSAGAGSFVSALSHVLQKEPDYILGKPNKPMFDAVKEVYVFALLQCIFVCNSVHASFNTPVCVCVCVC
jgi:ribonucleotide monophosphatase NagD (HAD superfamily)